MAEYIECKEIYNNDKAFVTYRRSKDRLKLSALLFTFRYLDFIVVSILINDN